MMGFGVVTPYHCWNGFFMRGQFTAIFPKHIFNATLDLAKDYIKTASNQALALDATPKYRSHKASGQAIVTIQGHDFYLGPWNSKGSKVE